MKEKVFLYITICIWEQLFFILSWLIFTCKLYAYTLTIKDVFCVCTAYANQGEVWENSRADQCNTFNEQGQDHLHLLVLKASH